jgi:hypothetical protein
LPFRAFVLQNAAMIRSRSDVIAAVAIGVDHFAIHRCPRARPADRKSRRKNAFVYRAGFPDELDPLQLGLRNKPNNLTHISLQSWPGTVSF